MSAPGGLAHLARRFFGYLRARPLDPDEQQRVADALPGHLAPLFWAQQAADQRHAFDCFAFVTARAPQRPDLAEAALLHDVGKARSRLGVVGRTAASLLALAGLARPGRLTSYLDHGPLGAADLRSAGADPLTVAFAAGHHGPCPEQFDTADWELLRAADAA